MRHYTMIAERALLPDDSDSDDEPGVRAPDGQPGRGSYAIAMCVLVVVIVFVAAGGLAAGAIYTHATGGTTTAVAHLTLLANTSADVCTDPWTFTCGGFTDSHYKHGSSIGVFQQRVNAHVRERLDADTESQPAIFYQTCTAAAEIGVRNRTYLWQWQRGYAAANVSFGWATHPTKRYQTLPYVYISGTLVDKPHIFSVHSSDPCEHYIADLLVTVAQHSTIDQIMFYGSYTLFCAQPRLQPGNTSQVGPVGTSDADCLWHTTRLWPGHVSKLSAHVLPQTAMTVVQSVFKAIQGEYVAYFASSPEYSVLADKIQHITCETKYTAPIESYATLSGSFESMLDTIAFQQFENEIHATSISPGWAMGATEVNAYYAPLENTLYILPAMAMFVYESQTNLPLLYGRLGYIIGHEIGHAVDSQGVLYDKTGTYVPETIMAPATLTAFTTSRSCFVSEFQTAGRTVDEDIADHLGITIAQRIMRRVPAVPSLRVCAPECTELGSMAQFYMYFSQTWCSARDAFVDETDVHSPGKSRVVHALADIRASAAFACASASPLNTCTVYGL